jgi:hypothetical protein
LGSRIAGSGGQPQCNHRTHKEHAFYSESRHGRHSTMNLGELQNDPAAF